MKVLLVANGYQSKEALIRALDDERVGDIPRFSDFGRHLNTQPVDLKFLESAPYMRRLMYRFMPRDLAMGIEIFFHRHEYDVVVTWSETISVFFAILQRVTFSRTPHVALLYWMTKPNIKYLLWLAHPAITRIITWTSVQRKLAIDTLGIPAGKISLVKHPVDEGFWYRKDRKEKESLGEVKEGDYICSAGTEMRDYPTLFTAMKGLDFNCRIGSTRLHLPGFLRAKVIVTEDFYKFLPKNVDIRPYTLLGLRELMQQSKFVVIPILPTDTDNGVTVILQAMAAGKAVVCSRTHGQVDVIKDGETGLYVDVGNPEELRKVIQFLWDNPDEARRLGYNARKYIEQSNHRFDRFIDDVVKIVRDVIAKKSSKSFSN